MGIAFTPFVLVIVFQVQVADFSLCWVYAEREAAVPGDA